MSRWEFVINIQDSPVTIVSKLAIKNEENSYD